MLVIQRANEKVPWGLKLEGGTGTGKPLCIIAVTPINRYK